MKNYSTATLFKLLKDKKVADSFQFYTSCEYKLYFAETSIQALDNIIAQYQTEESERVTKVFSDAVKTGIGKYIAHESVVDYFGVEMNVTVAMDKLTMEIIGLLHNFFDTYAQWVNSALLGEQELPIKKASLVNVAQEIKKYPEYFGDFIDTFINLPTNQDYLYIADFNNTLKHRYQIYVNNRFDIFSVSGDVSIPAFAKDGRVHIKKDAIDILKNSLIFCKKLLSDSQMYIEQYYSAHECGYVSHRMYNPKTHLVFKSEEDYKAMRSPINHYYYIEVDAGNLLDEYHIMLSCDRMSEENDDDKSLECFNSDYPIIMLKDCGTNDIIGILKPKDSEVFKLNDEHELQYRKYETIKNDYQQEMFTAICGNENFIYHPYLSDMTGAILKEN